jgi:OOP family OmpA-OmpF porin
MKYRSGLLAALLSVAIAAPVFAQGNTTAAPSTDATAPTSSDAGSAPPTDAAPTDAAAAPTDAAPTDAAAAPADAAPAEAAPADASAAAPAEAAPAEAAPTEAAASSSSSSSDDSEAKTSWVKGRPFYVSPMFSYTLVDGDRGNKNGLGGVLSVGKKLTDGLNLELTTFYSTLKGDSKATGGGFSGNTKLKGAGLTAMVFPLSTLPNAFGIISVNYGTGENAPYGQPLNSNNPTTVGKLDYHTTVFDLGVGYLFPIIPNHMLLRAEARYRMDSHGREFLGIHDGDRSAFYEGVFNVGLLFPLGVTTPAPAPVEQVAVVPPVETPPPAPTCPNKPADMPEGAPVGPDGCPLDSDGDGVPDYMDECPHTPAGAKVLANGCALKDDCRTPKAGEAVDENGCAVNKAFILKGVNFEFDSDRLTPDAKEILNGVGETLKSYADLKIEVGGHTDDVGTEAYNLGLSERRANSVKTYLGSRGVDVSRLTPVGYGKTKPLVEGTTDEDRAKNRRVELNVKE